MPAAETDTRTRLTADAAIEPPVDAVEVPAEAPLESAAAQVETQVEATPEPTKTEPEAKEEAPAPKEKSEVEKLVEKFASDAKQDEVEDPTPSEGEEEKTVETPAAPAKPAPQDDLALFEKRVRDRIPSKDRITLDGLLKKAREGDAKIKDLEAKAPSAALGDDILAVCQKHRWQPDDYKAWVSLGARAHGGDKEALGILANHLRTVGALPPEPKAPEWTVEDERWLSEQIEAGEISQAAAKALRAKAGKIGTPPAPVQPPQPVARPQPQTPQHPPGFEPAAVETGKATLAKKFESLTAEFPDAGTRDKVMAEIQTKMEGFRGTPPAVWGQVFDSVKEGIVTRIRAASVRPVGKSTLRPSTQSTGSAPQFKSERDRILHKYAK